MERIFERLLTIVVTLVVVILGLNLLVSVALRLLAEASERVGHAIGVRGGLLLDGLIVLVVLGVGARAIGWTLDRWRRVSRKVDGGRRPLGHGSRRLAEDVPVERAGERVRRRDPALRFDRRKP